jgi:hypothetical protein
MDRYMQRTQIVPIMLLLPKMEDEFNDMTPNFKFYGMKPKQ